jgi:hypothetical protein
LGPPCHLFQWPCAKTGTGTGFDILAYLMLLLVCALVVGLVVPSTGTFLGIVLIGCLLVGLFLSPVPIFLLPIALLGAVPWVTILVPRLCAGSLSLLTELPLCPCGRVILCLVCCCLIICCLVCFSLLLVASVGCCLFLLPLSILGCRNINMGYEWAKD